MKHGSPEKPSSRTSFGMNIIMDWSCNSVGIPHHDEEMRSKREKTSIGQKRGQDVASDMYSLIDHWSLALCLRRGVVSRQKEAFPNVIYECFAVALTSSKADCQYCLTECMVPS